MAETCWYDCKPFAWVKQSPGAGSCEGQEGRAAGELASVQGTGVRGLVWGLVDAAERV